VREPCDSSRGDQGSAGVSSQLPTADAARDSLETADALDVLVEALRRGGKSRTSEARALAERAVKIRERASGLDRLDTFALKPESSRGHLVRASIQLEA